MESDDTEFNWRAAKERIDYLRAREEKLQKAAHKVAKEVRKCADEIQMWQQLLVENLGLKGYIAIRRRGLSGL